MRAGVVGGGSSLVVPAGAVAISPVPPIDGVLDAVVWWREMQGAAEGLDARKLTSHRRRLGSIAPSCDVHCQP